MAVESGCSEGRRENDRMIAISIKSASTCREHETRSLIEVENFDSRNVQFRVVLRDVCDEAGDQAGNE